MELVRETPITSHLGKNLSKTCSDNGHHATEPSPLEETGPIWHVAVNTIASQETRFPSSPDRLRGASSQHASRISRQSRSGIFDRWNAFGASFAIPLFVPDGLEAWQELLGLHIGFGTHRRLFVQMSVGFITLAPYWQ